MSMNDQIADMLTRIRNANSINRASVTMPSSKAKVGIAAVLKREGYVGEYTVSGEGKDSELTISLKYGPEGEKVIQKIIRESSPGCRVYVGTDDLPNILNGLGIAVMSTNKGIISDREARKENVGGEILAIVY